MVRRPRDSEVGSGASSLGLSGIRDGRTVMNGSNDEDGRDQDANYGVDE